MTWLLVTISPSADTTKPDPSALDRCCICGAPKPGSPNGDSGPGKPGMPKSRNRSENGLPGGNAGPPRWRVAGRDTTEVVVMLTTAGLTSATIPEKLCGMIEPTAATWSPAAVVASGACGTSPLLAASGVVVVSGVPGTASAGGSACA